MSIKMESKSGFARTKRRRESAGALPIHISRASVLSQRLNRLSKKMKANNPSHLYHADAASIWSTISTTGTLFDLASTLAQGDNYTDRFSSSCILTRLCIRGLLQPGGTSTVLSSVRITVFRGQSGLAFAAGMTTSYSPIRTSTSTRLIFDKYYNVGATQTASGFGTSVNINLKLNHHQKFTGSAASTQTGESIYAIVQSSNAAGTTAPYFSTGLVEVYFQPT